MWNREETQTPRHDNAPKTGATPAAPQPVVPISAAPTPVSRAVASMGASLVIKGDVSGSEDLVIDGRIEGKISLPGHLLTIGPQAKILAEIAAKAVIIQGSVTGNVTASERFEIKAGGRMTGDLVSPKVVMAEGSEFSGRVDMRRNAGDSRTRPEAEVKLQAVAV